MESSVPCGHSNPLLSFSNFIHQNCHRLGAELATRFNNTNKRFAGTLDLPPPPPFLSLLASITQPKHALAAAATLSSQQVAKSLAGTKLFTVSNSNNEFVLISDAEGAKSIGLLCFRQEDAEAFLAQVRSRRRELRGKPRVVPINLDQVYMLKVEGIAFRFLPDPIQIKNAIELKAGKGNKGSFDGVPVFQSDLLVVKKKNKRYCPVYFSKEDIEHELSKVSRASRGVGVSQNIMQVGSLEDVLKKMEMSERNSGWEDLIFIPPGKSHSQHIQEIEA
ncbi:protein TIC 22, chloroplastic isoform X1 [Arachis hypogaea]|uniref:protein TIC 22, chloroplastic isoform X1 n=1 Tax=Arachis hypogaea TaxID=3818 RepID=UPI000DEDAA53|nr:protein TIC 22, chloroplastic isoform X1 [Arachis hypogaea]